MAFGNLFQRSESLIALDIGAKSLRLVELELGENSLRLINMGSAPLSPDMFSANSIAQGDKVSEEIHALLEANSIGDRRVVTAVPGPSVFTKRIKVPKMTAAELNTHIQFEAGNFIPQDIGAVKLDYHVLGESGAQLDVLVVAVKNEIIDSFLDCFALAGLEVAVVDVDYFALQNIFEANYPEELEKTTALINVGCRFSSINVCRGGESLFTGDLAVGGKLFTDAIAEELGSSRVDAEKWKCNIESAGEKKDIVREIIDRNIEYVAGEFNRQLSFFWNASGVEEGIDLLRVTGGGAQVPGLLEELQEKTGIECAEIDVLRNVEIGSEVDPEYVKENASSLAIALGLALRRPGDKVVPEFE